MGIKHIENKDLLSHMKPIEELLADMRNVELEYDEDTGQPKDGPYRSEDKTIEDFYRVLKIPTPDGIRDHIIFDYIEIWNDPVPLYLTISERGAKAKSTQAKLIQNLVWRAYKGRSFWLMNTEKLLKKEKKSHLTKPKTHLREWFTKDIDIDGDNVIQKTTWTEETVNAKGVVKEIEKSESDWYMKFSPLSGAENEKGSRDDYYLGIYDEFNVGLGLIRNVQTDLFSSLIGTMSDPVNIEDDRFRKLIIHGNNKSLNNQLLVDLGVLSIRHEVTDVFVGGFKLMRIISPIMDEEEKQKIIELNAKNWKFKLQEKLGKAGHVYFNENLFDEVNNVNQWMLTLPIVNKYTLLIDGYYFNALIIDSKELGRVLYFIEADKPKNNQNVLAMNKKDVVEGVALNENIKPAFFKYLAADSIYFFSAYIRETVIKAIHK